MRRDLHAVARVREQCAQPSRLEAGEAVAPRGLPFQQRQQVAAQSLQCFRRQEVFYDHAAIALQHRDDVADSSIARKLGEAAHVVFLCQSVSAYSALRFATRRATTANTARLAPVATVNSA